MGDVLKGNFKTKKSVAVEQKKEDLNTRFEREALKRLGGSIAFVSKKKFIYNPTEGKSKKESDNT